jgi:DNA-binding GntR family transcriptional regulator
VEIDRSSPVPVWRQIADELRAQIESGEIRNRLPGEQHLTQEYGVTLKTVRHAIAVLRDEGVLVTVPGLGSFVKRD